jgi:hypothetical protein
MAPIDDFVFITESTASGADRRTIKLAKSKARSHAAIVSRARAARAKNLSQDVGPKTQSPDKSLLHRSGLSRTSSPETVDGTPSTASHQESTDVSVSDESDSPKNNSPPSRRKWHPPQVKFRLATQPRQTRSASPPIQDAAILNGSLPKSVVQSTLDPFLQVAVDLSVTDRHLLHSCTLSLLVSRSDPLTQQQIWARCRWARSSVQVQS